MRRLRGVAPGVVAVLGLCVQPGAAAERRSELRINPFVRPEVLGVPAAGAGAGAVRPAGVWEAVLVATLVAGEDSLVNLGGVILGLGEEAHGYRLEAVRAWEAVFVKDGERLILPVERPREP